MNLVDSCGWLEYFADGPNADFFAPHIEKTENLIVPTICILEVFKVVLKQRNENAALQAVALMEQGKVVALSDSIAISAARLGIDNKLPLADSVILSTARVNRAVIWTQDADFKGIDGIEYIEKSKL
ncbi:MAG: type II toxin-antitoxin system VapC family toxin [Deltaproteobacteria bacterium]|nr:type II toxin-antitoxin system VapC family toxin [Deltaproteobacteria bacterium]